uniref:Uncharacterized protein n=1 Tax=Salarias fasciatus TaxID=181472 RepID=A0A672FHC0_SALFA
MLIFTFSWFSQNIFIHNNLNTAINIYQGSPTHRQCHMTITNRCSSYSLVNPRWYTKSGRCAEPFPPTIPSNALESALFKKTPHAARGSAGVVTYDLLHNKSKRISEKIAIMFSNPYDLNLRSNVFAVGIFDKWKECNRSLHDEMEGTCSPYFVRSEASGGALNFEGKAVTIRATMSDGHQTVMKVEVSESQ